MAQSRWWLLGCLLAVTHGPAVAADIEFANGLYRERKYDFAAKEYEDFLRESAASPRAHEARFFLAESYAQLGQSELALPLYERLTQTAPKGDRYHRLALFRLGQFTLDARDFKRSRSLLNDFIGQYPDDPLLASAYYLLGEAALGQNDDAGASKAFAEALRRQPEQTVRANIVYGQAKLAEKQGDVAAAIQRYQSLAGQTELSVADDAQLALGVLLFQSGRYQEALEAFDRLATQFPKSNLLPNGALNRGLCLFQLGRFNEAVAQLRTVTDQKDQPGYAALAGDAWLYLGRAFAARGDTDLAVQTLRQASRQSPDSQQQARMLAEAWKLRLDAGQAKEALEGLLALAESHPDYLELDRVWFLACSAAASTGDVETSQQAFEKLQSGHPTSPWRDRAAVEMVRASLDNPTAPIGRDSIEKLIGQTTQPASRQRLQYYLALVDFRAERYDEAFRAVSQLLDKDVADDQLAQDCRYLAGVSLAKQGRSDEAVAQLTGFLASTKDPVLAGSAAKHLGEAAASLPEPQAKMLVSSVVNELRKQKTPASLLGKFADGLYESGLAEEASGVYRTALSADASGQEKATLELGLCWSLVDLQQYDAALKQLQSAAAAGPEAHYLTGVCHQGLNQDAEALRAFEAVLSDPAKENEYRLEAAVRSAKILVRQGEYAKADELLLRAANDAPDGQKERIAYERAWLAADAQQLEPARKLFQEFIENHPGSPSAGEAMLKLAEIEYAAGDFAASLKWTKTLAQSRPAESLLPNLYYRQGAAAFRLKQTAEAREAFESLQRVAGDDATLRSLADYWLAETAFEDADAKDAESLYRRLLDDPAAMKYHGAAQLRIAELALRDRNWQAAFDEAGRVQSLTSDASLTRQALFVQAKALQQRAQFDQARELYAEALSDQRDELSAKSQFMIAETYLHQRQYRAALREYLKVEILYSQPEWRSMALLQIAKCHQSLNEADDARAAVEKLLQQYPDSEAAKQARQTDVGQGTAG